MTQLAHTHKGGILKRESEGESAAGAAGLAVADGETEASAERSERLGQMLLGQLDLPRQHARGADLTEIYFLTLGKAAGLKPAARLLGFWRKFFVACRQLPSVPLDGAGGDREL